MKRSILIVDHGSRSERANRTVGCIARLVASRVPQIIVEHAHLELASPTIAEGFAACVAAGAKEVIVCPYMLVPGRHATSDIPRLAAAAAGEYPGVAHRVVAPLGVDPLLGELVLLRAGLVTPRAPVADCDGEPTSCANPWCRTGRAADG